MNEAAKTFRKFIAFSAIAILAGTAQSADKKIAVDDVIPKYSQADSDSTLCAPMPKATGHIISVSPYQTSQLQDIINAARPGDTIELGDGYYPLNGINLMISTPGISLRSASGNPDAVILDGSYRSTQMITVAASNIKIAEISLERAFTHPVHVVSSDYGDTINTLLYRLKIIDPREQAIKINPHKPGSYVDFGTIACSSLILTSDGREKVNTVSGGCYTGGIDAHQAAGWIVRDNSISGFWCSSGLSQHAIHFWRGSRDTLIERNSLSDNARGIGLGLMDSGDTRTYADTICNQSQADYVGHYGGMIRNNFIYASSGELFNSSDGFDCGICLWSACNVNVVHNTIVSSGDNFSSIEWRYKGSRGNNIYNNIVSHALRERDGASARVEGNLQKASPYLFVDFQRGDLHLKNSARSAIDKGVRLNPGISDFDIDDEKRYAYPDIGADEK